MVGGLEESVVVEGASSRIEARSSGFEARFGPEDLRAIPVRRFSMRKCKRVGGGHRSAFVARSGEILTAERTFDRTHVVIADPTDLRRQSAPNAFE